MIYFLVLLFEFCQLATNTDVKKPSIVLVHGIGGTQMEAKLNRSSTEHFYCYKSSNWYLIWLNIGDDIFAQNCFFDNFKMVYNPLKNVMENVEGVITRPVGEFGSTDGSENLNPWIKYVSLYFGTIVEALIHKFNYSRSYDMFGASYDFRTIGDIRIMKEYFQRLTKLIENIYFNRGSRIMLISHSMGGPIVAKFLSQKPFEWKEKYIDSWYSIAGSMGGSMSSLQAHLFGYQFGLPMYIVPLYKLRKLQVTFPAIYYELPHKDVYSSDYVLVSTVWKNYTTSDIRDLIKNTDTSNITNMFDNIAEIFVETAPDVDMVCSYGRDIKTLSKIIFKEETFESNYVFEYDDGDGTVPYSSLKLCQRWITTNKKSTRITEFPSSEHLSMLWDERVVADIVDYVHSRIEKINKKSKKVFLNRN